MSTLSGSRDRWSRSVIKTTAILLTFLSVPAAASPHHRHRHKQVVEVYSPPPLPVSERFRTRFAAVLSYGSKTVPILQEGDISLPLSLNVWECALTPQMNSESGEKTYRNIACSPGNDAAVVVEAACPTNAVGTDSGEMVIANQKTKASADLTITCKTEAVSPHAPIQTF